MCRLPLRLAVFLALVLGIAASARAATIHVPADQPTIQAGIDAATNGDTVLVAAGTYKENIDFKGKAITVISESGAAQTIIDGSQGQGPAVSFTSGETRQSILSGFTVQNGGSEASGQAGGIVMEGSQPSLVNDIITQSHCYGVWILSSSPMIQNSNINNTLDANRSCSFGAGAAIYIEGSTVDSNGNIVPPVIIGNTIENNVQSGLEDAGGNGGAGIAIWGGNPIIENNIIRNNHTHDGQGGAILIYANDSAAVNPGGALMIVQNLIYGNQAGGGGGALAFNGYPGAVSIYIANNTIVDNTFPTGEGGDSNDYAVSQIYSGDYAYDGTSVALVNNIIAGNTTQPAIQCGWGIDAADESEQPIFDHNLLLNSGGPIFTSNCVDVSAKYGNITANPLFVNQSGNDYHLQAGSPAINAGNTSVLQSLAANGLDLTTDFDGNPRVADATGFAVAVTGYPVIDMGAYEYTGAQDAKPTTIVLTPSQYGVDGGTSLTLTAKLLSASGTPTGNVTFLEDGKQIGVEAIDGDGTAEVQTPPLVPGTHSFIATYAGQGSFTPATSVVVIVKVNVYSVTLTLTSAPNPSLVGQSVTFKTSISAADGIPAGAIRLTDTDTNTTLATLTPDASGNASYTTSTLTVGDHYVTASYTGDSSHANASAAVNQVVENGIPTTTSLVSSLNPSLLGQSVTFTATVASSGSGTPAGSVTFLDGGTTLATVTLLNGAAAYTTSSLTAGSHAITANYTPASGWQASSATLTQTVNGKPTTTAIIAAPNPAYALANVTLTAHVTTTASGTPTGTVTFSDGATTLGPATLLASGTATLQTSFAAASATPHQLIAAYSGDTAFNASTSTPFAETIQFNSTTTQITTIVPQPAGAYLPVTLSAIVSSSTSPGHTPTGTVSFSTTAGKPLGSAALVDGTASANINAGPAGNYQVVASYSGDTAFFPSGSPAATFVVGTDVSTVNLTSSANPSISGSPLTFTATVSAQGTGTPLTGIIEFFDGATELGQRTAIVNGSATYITSTLAIGTHPITAVYSGNASVTGSTSAVLNQLVVPYTGDFTLTVKPGSTSLYTGESARFTVTATVQGGFNLPLTLACTGLPANAACVFTPSSLGGSSGYESTLTLKTTAPAAPSSSSRLTGGATAALAAVFGLLFLPRRRRLWTACLLAAFLTSTLTALSGCGASGSLTGGTPPGTYTVNVVAQTTAVSPQLDHSATIQLTVKSLF